MKRILFILLTSLLVFSSCSRESKAKSLIKSDLKETMKDWSSYESVKFGKLDSTYSNFAKTNEGFELNNEIFDLKRDADSLQEEIDLMDYDDPQIHEKISEEKSLLNNVIHLGSIYQKKEKAFKSVFDGWKMEHTYRGKNSFGAKMIITTIFYFDKNVTKVVDKSNLDDGDKQ